MPTRRRGFSASALSAIRALCFQLKKNQNSQRKNSTDISAVSAHFSISVLIFQLEYCHRAYIFFMGATFISSDRSSYSYGGQIYLSIQIGRQPVLRFSAFPLISISANIFSLFFSLILSFSLLFSFCRSVPPEVLRLFWLLGWKPQSQGLCGSKRRNRGLSQKCLIFFTKWVQIWYKTTKKNI